MSKKEIKEHFLQPVVEQTSPWEFMLAKASSSRSGSVDTTRLVRDFVALRESLNNTYPEIRGVTSPFCLGGCLLELPCETDDAHEAGGGRTYTNSIFFRTYTNSIKGQKKIFGQIPVQT